MSNIIKFKNPQAPASWRQINTASYEVANAFDQNYYVVRKLLISRVWDTDRNLVDKPMTMKEISYLIELDNLPEWLYTGLNMVSPLPKKDRYEKMEKAKDFLKKKDKKAKSDKLLKKSVARNRETVVKELELEGKARENDQFVIEHNVPIPTKLGKWGMDVLGLLKEMKIGDSIGNLTKYQAQAFGHAARYYVTDNSIKIVRRSSKRKASLTDKTYRIWRVE